jgi:chromosome condensin MukBEF MukE localization factor
MHCFKLLGQRSRCPHLDRQITELKVRAAILNRFSQIGTPNTMHV